MTSQRPDQSRFVTGKRGLAGEVGDLRDDVEEELSPMAALAVEEWENVAAADTDGVLASVASANGDVAYVEADLVGAAAVVLDPPRNVTITTGGTAANGFTDCEVVGKDINGDDMTEAIGSINSAATHAGAKCFAEVTGLNFTGGTDATATHEAGFGSIIGLAKPMKTRAGAGAMLSAIEAGTLGAPPAGTVEVAGTAEPNGSYDASAAPNGTNDYAVYYEYDPTA
jgi:hypothetical protein